MEPTDTSARTWGSDLCASLSLDELDFHVWEKEGNDV